MSQSVSEVHHSALELGVGKQYTVANVCLRYLKLPHVRPSSPAGLGLERQVSAALNAAWESVRQR